MDPMTVLSSTLMVRWDLDRQALSIIHPDKESFPFPLIELASSTLDDMDWKDASQFIGERIMLLIPELRDRYIDPATGQLFGI